MVFSPGVELKGFPVKYLRNWGYSPAFKRWLEAKITDFDIVHASSLWLYPNMAISKVASEKAVPYIIRPAGSLEPWCIQESGTLKYYYLKFIERDVIEKAAALHAASIMEQENFVPFNFSTPSFYVPNGIDLSSYASKKEKGIIRKELGLPQDKKIILFLSRIHPKKNLEFLGRVFKKIREQTNSFLLIVGPDQHSYGEKIKAYYKELSLQSDYIFWGESTGEEKSKIYHAADVFCLPTHSENFGVVILEALASGLPVVVSDHTPWKVIEGKEVGYCLPLKEELFEEKLVEVLNSDSSKMKRKAKAIAKDFSWETVTRKLILKFEEIIH